MNLIMTSRNYIPVPALTGRLAAMRALLMRFEHALVVGQIDSKKAGELAEAMDKAELDVKALAGMVSTK